MPIEDVVNDTPALNASVIAEKTPRMPISSVCILLALFSALIAARSADLSASFVLASSFLDCLRLLLARPISPTTILILPLPLPARFASSAT